MMKKTPSFFYTKIIIISGAMFLLGMFFGHPIFLSSERQEADFPEIRQIIEKYHQAPSEQKIKDSFIHAYVTAYGDKYTQYFSPEEVLSFQTMIDGDFEGIGAYVEDDANGIYISGVLPGSPAQQAGLIPGDIIQAVDGETMHAKTANEAVIKIRGPAGSPVVLDIFSTVMGTKKQVTILRRHLEIPVIKDEIRDGVLVIQLFSFNDHSRDDVAQVLQKNKGKYNAILLDLRNNGGGTLQSAVDVASLFLSTGKVIATVDENLGQSIAPSLQENVERYVSHGTEDIKTPFYILTNGQTASAAEILASALHFYLKAPIFGSQTYGKGSVQQIFPLSNGGEIKVTIAHWYTADNVLLDGTGLTPTTVVLPTVDDITQGNDGQLKSTISQIVHALPSQK